MALTEKTIYDKVEVVGDEGWTIQWRRNTQIAQVQVRKETWGNSSKDKWSKSSKMLCGLWSQKQYPIPISRRNLAIISFGFMRLSYLNKPLK